jgi:hypothetical protein
VQHAEEANFCAKMLGIAGDFEVFLHWFGTRDRRRPSYSEESVGLTGEVA